MYVNNIFDLASFSEAAALELFRYQWHHNSVYREWCNLINCNPDDVKDIFHIPFLPISFFKTHSVVTGQFEPQTIFTSSGTTQTSNSRHLVKNIQLYQKSFTSAFEQFYGDVKNICILGLLPSYLERSGSSLVYMIDNLIKASAHPLSGFYLYDFENLKITLELLERTKQPTLLIGVTFALLDFAETYAIPLHNTIVMETGGMKGRKEEMTREAIQANLKQAFGVSFIHSEYSMTELMSQAYSKGEGIYHCPPWMKVLVRDEDDPFEVREYGRGVLNIIDLANKDSCAFIATDDAGVVRSDFSFEVLGRIDNSDLRGCSLLSL